LNEKNVKKSGTAPACVWKKGKHKEKKIKARNTCASIRKKGSLKKKPSRTPGEAPGQAKGKGKQHKAPNKTERNRVGAEGSLVRCSSTQKGTRFDNRRPRKQSSSGAKGGNPTCLQKTGKGEWRNKNGKDPRPKKTQSKRTAPGQLRKKGYREESYPNPSMKTRRLVKKCQKAKANPNSYKKLENQNTQRRTHLHPTVH